MENKKFCIANWKLNKNSNQGIEFLNKFQNLDLLNTDTSIIICPSFISLQEMIDVNSNMKIDFGAQNISQHLKGSFTGEISTDMLESINCFWSIIGHSERRIFFNETNEIVSSKMKAVFNSKINPILCIGESLDDKDKGNTEIVLKEQLISAFGNIESNINKDILIAYEPIWAIGTGRAADINTIKFSMKIIKNIIKKININHCNIWLLYGGSVNTKNASEILKINNVSGFLIGTSSLNVDEFYDIYKKFKE